MRSYPACHTVLPSTTTRTEDTREALYFAVEDNPKRRTSARDWKFGLPISCFPCLVPEKEKLGSEVFAERRIACLPGDLPVYDDHNKNGKEPEAPMETPVGHVRIRKSD